MYDYLFPLLDAGEVKDNLGYFDETDTFVNSLILGAQSLLANAGAFHQDVPLTQTVIHLIVGHWLENRDLMNYDYQRVGNLPISLQAMITSLQFWAQAEKPPDDGSD